MKFAIIGGKRVEAQPGLTGECPGCGQPLGTKCGEVRVWHWAHEGRRRCDPWWENETEWHRAWKNHFPTEWQEIIHRSDDGERHIADVKTAQGWVIEFQHSAIKPEERRSREGFYQKLVWIVDGTRRKRASTQIVRAWTEGLEVTGGAPGLRQAHSDECRALSDWMGARGAVFFDLGEPDTIWLFVAGDGPGPIYVFPVLRAKFIDSHRVHSLDTVHPYDAFMQETMGRIVSCESARLSRTAPSFVTPTWPGMRGRRRPRPFRL